MDEGSASAVLAWLAMAIGAAGAAYVNYRWWWWIHPNRSLLDLSKQRTGPEVETFGDMMQKWMPTVILTVVSFIATINTGVAIFRLL
jgi:hypothetical protein